MGHRPSPSVINECADRGMNNLESLAGASLGRAAVGAGGVAESIAIRSLAPVCFQDLQPKEPVIKS